MRKTEDDSKAKGCANQISFVIYLVVIIPVGYIMNSLGISTGFILGVAACVLIVMLSVVGNEK